MIKNGFEALYDGLFSGENRVLFETMTRDGKNTVDSRQFKNLTDRIAANLSVMYDVKPGGFAAVNIGNSYFLYAAVFAALKVGYSVLLINPGEKPDRIRRLMAEAGAELLITDKKAGYDEGDIKTARLQTLTEDSDVDFHPCWGEMMAFATSGTTGKSKVIAYGGDEIYRQVSRTARWFKETSYIGELLGERDLEDERVMSVLPMHHIFGCLCPLILLSYGFRMIFPKNDAVSTIIATIKEESVWGALSVPMFWQTILNIVSSRFGEFSEEAVAATLGDNFKFCLTGGTYAEAKLRKSFLKAGLTFTLGFGMTETGCCTMHFMDMTGIESEGRLYSWYDAVIRGEDGKLAEDGTGELLLKSDVLFKGYIKDGRLLTREADENGYFPTGDIFRKEGSRIDFVGRCRNIIVNSSGENIYIEELEHKFSALSKYGVLYGIVDIGGEPLLAVKLRGGEPMDEMSRDISSIVKTLPVYERPYKAVLTSGELPMTAKGEIRKVSVTEELLNDIADAEIVFKKR